MLQQISGLLGEPDSPNRALLCSEPNGEFGTGLASACGFSKRLAGESLRNAAESAAGCRSCSRCAAFLDAQSERV